MTSLQTLPLSERWTALCCECLAFRHDCKKGTDDLLRCYACHSRVYQGHPSRLEIQAFRPWYLRVYVATTTALNLWAETRSKHASCWGDATLDWTDLGVDPEELFEYMDTAISPCLFKGLKQCREKQAHRFLIEKKRAENQKENNL